MVKSTASVSERTVKVFFPGGKSDQPDPAAVQESLMRMADAYASTTVESVDELLAGPTPPLTMAQALEFKIASVTAVVSVAGGQNPYANLLDMGSLVTLTRMSVEYQFTNAPNGTIFERWAGRNQNLESNVWTLVDQVLSQEQQDELNATINEIYRTHAALKDNFLIRPAQMAVFRPRNVTTQHEEGSLFNLSGLDPFAGLDPAVREITETRLFAERAMYMLQRMPWILRWQSELLILETTSQPRVAQALEDATSLSESIDRASKAAETISQTAAGLPARISNERKAIVAALDAQESQITTMLQSGTEFSDSLGVTITNLDALMKRFGVGEVNINTAPRDPNAKPFDILEYAKTAEQVATMAKELNQTIDDLNSTLDSPALERLSSQATADLRGIFNHLFLLAGGLVVLVLVCALIYRMVAGRKAAP